MKHKTYIFTTALLSVFLSMPFFLLAQDPGGGPDVPIDGGLSILLAAGAAYGAKKYRDSRINKNTEEQENLK